MKVSPEDAIWPYVPENQGNAFCPIQFSFAEKEVDLFRLLQKAYVHARYKDVFSITGEEACLLQQRVNLLLEKINDEFGRLVAVQS